MAQAPLPYSQSALPVVSLAVSAPLVPALPPLAAPELLVLALDPQVADLAQEPEVSFPVEAPLGHGTPAATMYGLCMAQHITDTAMASVMATVMASLLADMSTVLSETTSAIMATGAAMVTLPTVSPGALVALEVLERLRLLPVLLLAGAQLEAAVQVQDSAQVQELVQLPVLAALAELANCRPGNSQPKSTFLAIRQKPNY